MPGGGIFIIAGISYEPLHGIMWVVLPGPEVYSSVTTCRHVASSLATSSRQNVNVLVLPVYSFVTSVYVCACQWVCICCKHGWCDAQLDYIHSYPSALMPTVTKAYSYPPASNQLQSYPWPTTSQLASAERDFVSYMRQASAGDVTARLVHRKTSRCWVLDII